MADVRRIWGSQRRRRRLLGALVASALGASVALLVVFARNTAPSYDTPLTSAPPKVLRNPPALHLSADDRRAAHRAAVLFIETAVRRRNLDEAWRLAAPSLRRGFTRKAWLKGDIPVVPYPADAPGYAPWQVLYAYQGHVLLEFALLPLRGSGVTRAQEFTIELAPSGPAGHRRWLVSAWAPRGGSSLTPDSPAAAAQRASMVAKAPLSVYWLLVPVGLLGSLLLVPIGLGLREWYRGVRARRLYGPPPPSPF